MEKKIGAFAVRRQFGKVLQEVIARGDSYVVERHGEPVAAVVPIEVYRQWKRERSAFFETLRTTQQHVNLTAEEVESLANEAVKAVRSGA
ncbi:MAG: type II toxin-antitoxin system Phd/YefM family antitoxin [Chloroflexi bacterium]|nr:type II toxin-antitoxin system Phd/YefM family antitoxin [Chloroflexota bacterium]